MLKDEGKIAIIFSFSSYKEMSVKDVVELINPKLIYTSRSEKDAFSIISHGIHISRIYNNPRDLIMKIF